MRKIFLFLAVIYSSVLFSQTLLTSHPLTLNKNPESNQILTTKNESTNEVFTFIANDENLTILRYNSALFLADQFNISMEYTKNRILSGYSFSEDGNPTLYWASPYKENIIIVKYYFETKTSKALVFQIPNRDQITITEYQIDNSYILSTYYKGRPEIVFYVFKNGMVDVKEFDFGSDFTFTDKKNQPKTFNQIISENPIEKMESGQYNPLFKAVSKTKMYALKDRFILTLDHDPKQTQLFEIDLNTLELKQRKLLQPITKKESKSSNSFYFENKLFQVNANEEELLFDIKDFDSEKTIKSITVSKKDTITFKNSPLLFQKDSRQPREIKNTAKFLQQLAHSKIGLSVFKNKKNIFITLGAAKEYHSSWTWNDNEFIDVDGMMPASNYYSRGEETHFESLFFESIWDKKLNTTAQIQEPLGRDKIYMFLDNNRKAKLNSILKFKDYYLLGYFDTQSKQYIMRKFTDGFD